ncbi:MAG: hypothetical protein IJZ44_09240 [Lachnospiraceae bacterium]|nr:hypothetical protein [Lachnospiraceae bacterium]
MKNLIKNLFLTILFSILLFFVLRYSHIAKEYAYLGLNTWYHQMIPSLLPFMIISSMLIHLNLDEIIIKPFSPILRMLYQISNPAIYVMVMGFLCGFPMGAKTAALEYESGKISKEEAEYLLAFVNNIGPAYYLSFVYGNIIPQKKLLTGLFLLYGIPLLYGFILRHTFYRNKISICSNSISLPHRKKEKTTLFFALDTSIHNGLTQISMLGGYMIICNLLVMIPKLLFAHTPILCSLFHNIMEISGGLLSIRALNLSSIQTFAYTHICLVFTGISCHLQTFHILHHSHLSCKKYMLHKIILCSIVCIILYVSIR